MNWKFFSLVGGCFLCVVSAPTSNVAPAPPPNRPWPALFTNYTAASFRVFPVANATMPVRDVNLELLDAAVFHETNYRREQAGLRPLAYSEKAREAARMQAFLQRHEHGDILLRATLLRPVLSWFVVPASAGRVHNRLNQHVPAG